VTLLHELRGFADLVAVVARKLGVDPGLVEKDYWIMNSLWGLQQGGVVFELKGGTPFCRMSLHSFR
jgi:predicted nucleotidyltransferase component of viral defense system